MVIFAITAGTLVIGRSTLMPKTLAKGCFHQVAHKGSGCAGLVRGADGKVFLELTDFETSDSPDLRVLLSSAPDAFENITVQNADQISLGPLTRTGGYQQFFVPANVSVEQFHSVTIWNTKYLVNFTTAPLK